MKQLKILLSVVIALTLMLNSSALATSAGYYQLGDTIEDFTVTTFDGKTVTLSEVLAEKDMVLINIWASWCGPCKMEFPYMEQAYQLYKDRIEIVALSCEPTDTDDVLADFAAEVGMSFPVAGDTPNFAAKFLASSIPTSVIVDRFGVVCFIEAGAITSLEGFTNLFDVFVGEEYTESLILENGVPPTLPNAEPSDGAALNAALNVPGGSLSFFNAEDKYAWPMITGEIDGRTVVFSSNTGVSSSRAIVNTTVTANAGDAVIVTFKTSTETAMDLMRLRINGEIVKSFGGEHDWMSYAYALEADGEYAVSVEYEKDSSYDSDVDCVWIDSIALVSGEDAAAALAANPAIPVSAETAFTVRNENAREVALTYPGGGALGGGTVRFYVVNDEKMDVSFTLGADIDPETALLYCNYDGSTAAVADCLKDGAYAASFGLDSVATTGYPNTDVYLYPDWTSEPCSSVTCFVDEQNLISFVEMLAASGYGELSWEYAAAPVEAAVSGDAAYTLKFVDQNGNPVSGVMAQVCDPTLCMVYVSDESGLCEFTLPAYPYEIHILKLPDGYEGDTESVTVVPAAGGTVEFVVNQK